MFEITIPVYKFPSLNHTYVRNINRTFKSKEVKEYQQTLADVVKYSMLSKKFTMIPKTTFITLELSFYVKNIHRDLDNMLKSTIDSLQGILFENDKQIIKLVAYKFKYTDYEFKSETLCLKVY